MFIRCVSDGSSRRALEREIKFSPTNILLSFVFPFVTFVSFVLAFP
jgi:hypothetical protein